MLEFEQDNELSNVIRNVDTGEQLYLGGIVEYNYDHDLGRDLPHTTPMIFTKKGHLEEDSFLFNNVLFERDGDEYVSKFRIGSLLKP